MHGAGAHEDGRRILRLSPAARVVDQGGAPLLHFVDDVTIAEALSREAPRASGLFRLVMDDLRLALLTERTAWGDEQTPESVLAPLLSLWSGTLGPQGLYGVKRPEQRALLDPQGHILGVVCEPEPDRERVCEVVTRPLSRSERAGVVTRVLDAASRLGFVVPEEAALHVHVDAAPWQSAAALSALMVAMNEHRDNLRETFETNPRCRKLAPFSDELMALAREALAYTSRSGVEPDFEDFASELRAAGVVKWTDVNLEGVVSPFPRQPTLEVRFLSMSLDAHKVLALVEQVESVLLGQWERGRGLCRFGH